MVDAWKVVNESKSATYCERKGVTTIKFSTGYKTALEGLSLERPLDPNTNEVLLIHRTLAERVYPILFNGLDRKKSVLRKTGWIKERNRKTKDIKFSLDIRFQKKISNLSKGGRKIY